MRGGALNVHRVLWGVPCFCYSLGGGGVIKIVVNISAECETVCDKYDSLIPRMDLIIKTKATVQVDSNIIDSNMKMK